MKTSKKLIICITIAFILLKISEAIGIIFFPTIFSTPLLFGLAISIPLNTTLLRKVAFIILSQGIYFLALYISLINEYHFPKLEFLILGTTIGALLEVMAFTVCYDRIKTLKIKHLLLTLFIGAISFGLPVFLIEDYFLSGYAIWYSGIAYVIYSIYNADKK